MGSAEGMSMTTIHRTSDVDGLRDRIRRFFYAPEVPYGLAVVRILLPLALLGAMGPRWFHARELYSTDGATTPLWITYGYAKMLPELPGTVVVALFSALILFLVTSSLGWCTRLSLIASTILYTYFNMVDAVSTITKYSVIGTHGLLLLSLSQCGAVWSVDSWLKGRRRRTDPWPGVPTLDQPASPAWPRRLMQLLIGIVYFGAAITKMHTPEYFSGDQLQTWMITNVNFHHPLGEYLALHPALLVVFAYVTIVWEIVFVFLAWRGWGRRLILAFGACFHVMTTLTLGLYIFPMVCLSLYFSFLNEDDVRGIARTLRRWKRRFGWTRSGWATNRRARDVSGGLTISARPLLRTHSMTAFGCVVCAAAAVGVAVEYQMDPYGERRPEGPYELRELDADSVHKLLGPSKRLQEIDKFASFHVGTVMVGGILANRRREFHQGQTLTAQCALNTPHEDMWVECNLHDAKDRLILRAGKVIPREMLRCNFYYKLPDALDDGAYDLVLLSGGREVMRRRISVQAPDAVAGQRSSPPTRLSRGEGPQRSGNRVGSPVAN